MNKNVRHKELCKKIHDMYETKNADYGDSFHTMYDEYGFTSALVQIANKYNRLKSYGSGTKMSHESITDTLMDLANYSLLTILEIEQQQEREKLHEGNKT